MDSDELKRLMNQNGDDLLDQVKRFEAEKKQLKQSKEGERLRLEDQRRHSEISRKQERHTRSRQAREERLAQNEADLAALQNLWKYTLGIDDMGRNVIHRLGAFMHKAFLPWVIVSWVSLFFSAGVFDNNLYVFFGRVLGLLVAIAFGFQGWMGNTKLSISKQYNWGLVVVGGIIFIILLCITQPALIDKMSSPMGEW